VNKRLEFSVDQQQWLQGYLPVVLLGNYVRYGTMVQNDLILTGPSFVTPENVQKVMRLLSGSTLLGPSQQLTFGRPNAIN
jgi:ABC-type sugar transport system substrate-binding protein